MAATTIAAMIDGILSAESWNRRVSLVRQIPEQFGSAQHQEIYSAIAEAVYVSELAPDFAYVHWRDEYELPVIEKAYERAVILTQKFVEVDANNLERAIITAPETLRIFRLFLGFTTQEFAGASVIPAAELGAPALTNGIVKSMEMGRRQRGRAAKIARGLAARIAAMVIDRAMRRELFPPPRDLRSKIDKPDTAAGWQTIRKYATENVPFPTFLHQRYYGGAFRQILDATSGQRGNLLEDAVKALFTARHIPFLRTGPRTKALIAGKFGITLAPAPDFVISDASGSFRAILECKQANDGGTARDKAARFSRLRNEGIRLGGVPVFAILAGLGWRRTGDALGPVLRDTDGRVFTAKTLEAMISVDPFPALLGEAAT